MGYREDYLFWNVVHTLTTEYGYGIVTMSENQKEIWLEHDEGHPFSMVRLFRYDFNWANVLKQDLHRTAHNGENIRKKLFKKPVSVLNVYISLFKPVDEYESYLERPLVNKKTTIQSMIIDSESQTERIIQLGNYLHADIYNVKANLENIEEADVEKVKSETLSAAVGRRKKEEQIFQFGKPIFTKVFLAIQIILFILMEIVGSSESSFTLSQFGAKDNSLILNGEWWRFITPVFIHIGFLHLLMNSVALFYIGSEVEKIYGSFRFFLIYLFAGFTGVLGSFIFSTNLSAGASGAIFGCFGALLYFGTQKRKLFLRTMGTSIIGLLIINLIFGFTMPGIDNAGHIGGLIGGFLAAAVVRLPNKKRMLQQALTSFIVILGCVGLLYIGYNNQNIENEDLYLASLAQEYANKGKQEKAKMLLTKALNRNEDLPTVHFVLGNFEVENKEYRQAQQYYLKALELNPDFHEAHYNIALTYLQEGDITRAKEHVESALDVKPDETAYRDLLEQIEDNN